MRNFYSNPQTYYQGLRISVMGLEDTVVGIVGAGRIGQSVASKVKQFAISRLLYCSRREKNESKTLMLLKIDLQYHVGRFGSISSLILYFSENFGC